MRTASALTMAAPVGFGTSASPLCTTINSVQGYNSLAIELSTLLALSFRGPELTHCRFPPPRRWFGDFRWHRDPAPAHHRVSARDKVTQPHGIVTWCTQSDPTGAGSANVRGVRGGLITEPAIGMNAWADISTTYSHQSSAPELPTAARTAPSAPGIDRSMHDRSSGAHQPQRESVKAPAQQWRSTVRPGSFDAESTNCSGIQCSD